MGASEIPARENGPPQPHSCQSHHRGRQAAPERRQVPPSGWRLTEDRINQLLSLYEQRIIDQARFKERYAGLEDKLKALEVELQSCDLPPSYAIHPKAVDQYRQLVDRLESALAEEDAYAVRDAFRGLLDRVVFHPLNGRGEYELELQGRLAALLQPQMPKAPQTAQTACEVMVGAGIGFEPMTFRLCA